MPEILSLSNRPQRFSELVGLKKVSEQLRGLKEARFPKALLFSGETGAGKTTVARIVALSLQCPHQEEFGEPCDDCIKNRSSYDIIEVNASEATTKEELEQIVKGAGYLPKSPSKYRVYLLDEAQKMSNGAQNLLLKYFEDGSAKTTVFIICTTEPSKILKPLRSRCTQFALPGLSVNGLEKLVKQTLLAGKSKKPADVLIDALLENGASSPRLVVMAAEKYMAGADAVAAGQVGFECSVDTLEVCRAVMQGSWDRVRAATEKATSEDARPIRASVCGYLKTVMLKAGVGVKTRKIAESIQELGKIYMDDGTALPVTLATLYTITKRMKGDNA
jgi:replication-associated recombination protein RarA